MRDHSRFNVTFLAVALYAIATVVLVPVAGLAIGYRYVFVWVLVGLAAAGVAAPRAAMRDLVRDWLPFFVAVATYDLLRGLADEWFAAHTLPLLYFDQWLFVGHVPTVWLQEHFFDASRLRVWDYVLYAVYLSHFVVPLAVAGVLWVRNRPGFRSFVARLLSLSYAAFVTYAVYPSVPPWLASANGDLAPTVRTQHVVWNELGFGSVAASFLESGNGVVNDVAAVPSLHAAFPMLILLFFWSRGRPLGASAPRLVRRGHGTGSGLRRGALGSRRVARLGVRGSGDIRGESGLEMARHAFEVYVVALPDRRNLA